MINNNIIVEILNKATLTTKTKLRMISKKYNDLINKNIFVLYPKSKEIKQNIIKRLKEIYNIDGNEFCNKLIENKCYISGGFLLYNIKPTGTAHDIDIYTFSDNNFRDYLDNNNFIEYNGNRETNMYKEFQKLNMEITNYHNKNDTISQFDEINYCHPLQFIRIHNHDISNFIKTFDISVCANFFDGENVYCYDIDGIENGIYLIDYDNLYSFGRIFKYAYKKYICKNFNEQLIKGKFINYNMMKRILDNNKIKYR